MSSQTVMATCNGWGAASGSKAEDNLAGTGSEIKGLVIWRPYLKFANVTSLMLLPNVIRP